MSSIQSLSQNVAVGTTWISGFGHRLYLRFVALRLQINANSISCTLLPFVQPAAKVRNPPCLSIFRHFLHAARLSASGWLRPFPLCRSKHTWLSCVEITIHCIISRKHDDMFLMFLRALDQDKLTWQKIRADLNELLAAICVISISWVN